MNLTDNPTATPHMSPVAAVAATTAAGVEATIQLTVRDRNRLALTGDLLGAWALGGPQPLLPVAEIRSTSGTTPTRRWWATST